MNHFLKSLLGAFVTIFGVMTLSFALIHFIPGDPIEIMLGEQASAVDKESLRKELGLNQPFVSAIYKLSKKTDPFGFRAIRSNQAPRTE